MKKYLKQSFATIDQGVREPRTIGPMARASLVKLWLSRGGGLYGLGYVFTFLAREVPAVIANFTAVVSGSASVAGAIFEWLIRFGSDTLMNMLWAFMWPVLLIELLGGWGIVILVAGFFAFEKLLRPLVESAVPELQQAAEDKRAKKAQKLAKKRQKKDNRKNGRQVQTNEFPIDGDERDVH